MNWKKVVVSGLLGWYLIFPPTNGRLTAVYPSAPYSSWRIINSYDFADECMVKIKKDNEFKKSHPEAICNTYKYSCHDRSARCYFVRDLEAMLMTKCRQLDAQVCIASDDPRLAK